MNGTPLVYVVVVSVVPIFSCFLTNNVGFVSCTHAQASSKRAAEHVADGFRLLRLDTTFAELYGRLEAGTTTPVGSPQISTAPSGTRSHSRTLHTQQGPVCEHPRLLRKASTRFRRFSRSLPAENGALHLEALPQIVLGSRPPGGANPCSSLSLRCFSMALCDVALILDTQQASPEVAPPEGSPPSRGVKRKRLGGEQHAGQPPMALDSQGFAFSAQFCCSGVPKYI